jgi:hypothetical protein
MGTLFIEAVLYVGGTLTAGKNITLDLRLFLLVGCVFDLPAYILSFSWPRAAGWWLQANVVGTAITYSFVLVRASSGGQPDLSLLSKLIGAAVLFLGARVTAGVLLIWLHRNAGLGAFKSFSSSRKVVTVTTGVFCCCYCLYWTLYLIGTWYSVDRFR